MTTIGFMGLGAMGSRMASRLLSAGHDVRLYNRTPAATEPLQTQGAKIVGSPRELASQSDIIISMLRDDEASQELWLDAEQGAIQGMKPGTIAIECSTVTPAHIRSLAAAMALKGFAFLEAPVIGSRPQAEAGQLIFLVGGDVKVMQQVTPILLTMGAAAHHLGVPGLGATMKLAVNSLFGIQVAAWAETLTWLDKAGIGHADAVNVLNALPTTSPALQGIGKLMAAGIDDPLFPIALVSKDFGYADALAASSYHPVLTLTKTVYDAAAEAGLSDRNIVAVKKLYEHKS